MKELLCLFVCFLILLISVFPDRQEKWALLQMFVLLFGQIGGGPGTSLVFPSSQLLLAQNNPYAKMAYFELAYSAAL